MFVPGTNVGELKMAAIAEFKLEVAPARVRLLLKAEGGGASKLLDSSTQLDQSVEGASVLVEVLREWRARSHFAPPPSNTPSHTLLPFCTPLQPCRT